MFVDWLSALMILGVCLNAAEALKDQIKIACRESARIENGEVVAQFDRWRDVYEIRQGKFHCKLGYQMNIHKNRISFECKNGTWQGWHRYSKLLHGFGLKDVKCAEIPNMCPKPSLIDNGRYKVKSRYCKPIRGVSSCVRKFFTGDQVEYNCDLGYKMRPVEIEKAEEESPQEHNDYSYGDYNNYYNEEEEKSAEFEPQIPNFTCSENGVWQNGQNDQFPKCDRIKCNGSRFENISNGYVKNFTDIYNYGQLEFGDVMELVCDRGYKPINNDRHLECYDVAIFDKAEFGCERIRCPKIADPIGGRAYFPNGSRYVDDMVTFHCEEYKSKLLGPKTMTCLENGKWSSDRCVRCFPKDADCLPPCMHEDNMLQTANPTFKHGSRIQLTCNNDQDIIHNRTCLLNNMWDNKDLYCYGKTDLTSILSTAGSLKEAMKSIGEHKNKSAIDLGEGFEGKSIRVKEMPGGVELYFALDVSGSISYDEFGLLKNFTLELIKQVNVSDEPDGTRLRLYAFASRPGLLYDGHWTNPGNVLANTDNAIEEVSKLLNQSKIQNQMFENDDEEFFVGQATNIKALMDELIDSEITKRTMREYDDRPTQQVVVLISDGEFNTAGNPAEQAQELKDKDVEIYSIYVGKDSQGAKLGKEVMKSLNSTIKNETHYFEIASEDMSVVLGQMISKTVTVCGDVDQSKKHFASQTTAKKEPADQHAWPWMVQFKDVHCGGSLIDRRHILTAAHCFYKDNKLSPRNKYTFFLKSHRKLFDVDDLAEESQEVSFENIKIHEKFDMDITPRYLYDIALVTLPKRVSFDLAKTLRPICLPENGEMADDVIGGRIPGIVTGWGKLRNGQSPDVLQQVQMVMPVESECTKSVRDEDKVKYSSTLMFCAGGSVGDQQVDSCGGDSGGPYVIKDPGNEDRFIQIGIVSSGFTTDCYQENQNGLYTKLNDELLQWIRDTIQTEEAEME